MHVDYGPVEVGSYQDFSGDPVLKQQSASSNNVVLPAENILEQLSKVAVSYFPMHC